MANRFKVFDSSGFTALDPDSRISDDMVRVACDETPDMVKASIEGLAFGDLKFEDAPWENQADALIANTILWLLAKMDEQGFEVDFLGVLSTYKMPATYKRMILALRRIGESRTDAPSVEDLDDMFSMPE
jgi:hypothetical protein